VITRFAPSPTGPLHLGHAFSALTGHDRARAVGGQFLLRIEDTDRARCRPAWETAIHADLRWLGLTWDGPVLRQSDHMPRYRAALAQLIAKGLCYPCTCNRADIQAALSAPQEGTVPEGYPGICRQRMMADWQPGQAIRLHAARALTGQPLRFRETGPEQPGWHAPDPGQIDDIVLARRDGMIAYHLAVVVDDAAQNVTDVTRGLDLFGATPVQVLLQSALGLPTPSYHHHRLIRDDQGRRLAKRDDARALTAYRANGATAQDIRRLVGL